MANIISQTLSQLHSNVRTAGFGVANSRRKITLFIPPSTQSPLFVYGKSPDQRSFLSLGTDYEGLYSDDGDDEHDGGELSRTVSLPSTTAGSVIHEPELNWLLEEHQRRYSSVKNSDEDESDGDDDSATEQQNYHGYEDNRDSFTAFMQRVTHNTNQYQQLQRANSMKRRNSLRSVGSLSLDMVLDEDFSKEEVTVKSEIKKLIQYAIPLIITFLLEHLFSVVCVLSVSHLGKVELAAVSLGSMTSNIIFAIFEGLSTVLDTLCPQAYGAGDKFTVGIHLQRCTALGMAIFIPFGIFWWYADFALALFVDDEEVVRLSTQFLRIMLPGAPAYIIFENLKRYLQAQGIFEAGTYVLLVCAPVNIIMSYFLVWDETYGLGFIGAPIAVSVNLWLMLILLVCYTKFINGIECWNGVSRKAFTQWKDLIDLAIPGIIMLEAESLSYEVLTLFASRFGTDYLATQSAVSTLSSFLYMIPFSVGIASSTRIANFIGARRIDCAQLASTIGIISSLVTGCFTCFLVVVFRSQIARIFTEDDKVIQMIVNICPLIAFSCIFDALSAVAGSALRGQGMQRIGSWINLVVYYLIGMPLVYLLGFYYDMKLNGLWIAMAFAFFLIGVSEAWFVLKADWGRIIQEADDRKDDELESGAY